MAIPPQVEFATDGGAFIELDEEIDGDEIGTRNYRFSKIGEPVPIRSDGNFEFDPQCLPSQPLAVSERSRLLFVVHPQGFYVARTKDVMASAEEIKEKKTGPSVKELSLVDVPIGKVSTLALSSDDSLLAATVASHVHFFAVSALLHKEQKPSYSVTLDDSICIKDMRWARKVAKDYIILSSQGKLYQGSGQGPLSCVMEGVYCVDWSVTGNFLAVAKKNTVSIFSSQFKEKLIFLLPFQSVVGDSDVNQVIKVDAIRWIRPDCIAVGCFQLNDDGEEENYIVQVITSRTGRISDDSAASKPVVLSFNTVFMDFCPDAVPARNGPHLFLRYLDSYGLAFIANRNLSQSVGLLCWPLESGRKEASVVEILNDAWTLHIDSQDDGEDNVLLGLSVDMVSQNENVRFTLGDEETEVSPCCVIACLTIDGKISVFHFASAIGAFVSPESCGSDEENDVAKVSLKHEESSDRTISTSGSHELKTGSKATITNDLSPSFQVDVRSQEHAATEKTGQKSLLDSQTVEVDEPKKVLSLTPSQDNNAENKSISEVKHTTGSSSGKVVGEFSRPINNYPVSGSNVEPFSKALPTSSPNMWSSTRSNARFDVSKTSGGSLLSRTPDEIDNSDKHALRSAGGLQQHPTDVKDKAKPSVTVASFGQTVSTAQGSRKSLPAYPISQAGSVASGKLFQSEFKKELNAASSSAGLPYTLQNASKQFGNVEEMAKKLDDLLEGIEGKGGFMDASINSLTNSVKDLEDGIWALSDRCRTWKGSLDDQLREVQIVLDKTVQVLLRKLYMEGIFKQATDSKYWELWNRQKLSTELELKRRHILELNQELTNKLIELERHFNSLEFNKFGENGGIQRNRRVLQNSHGHSRQTQSLYSLHSTMQAQLAAAEQLSGCLSRQMASLSIESSGKQDVKKKIFESIGLSYAGDTERSPARNGNFSTPSKKEHSITSGYIATKDQSIRNQTTFVKSYEPETARRRRDSLDHSWASYDPPKTTVKRMLKKDYEKGSANRSLLNIDKQYLSPQSQKKPEVAHSALLNISGVSSNHYKMRGTAEIPAKQFTESPSTSLLQRTPGLLDRGNQVSSTKGFSAFAPALETRMTQNSELGAFKLNDEKSKGSSSFLARTNSSTASESKFVPQSDTSFHPLSSISTQFPQQPTPLSDSTESLNRFKIGFTKSTTLDQKNSKIVSETPLFNFKMPVTPTSTFSSGPNALENGLFTKSSEKPSQANDGPSTSTPAFGSSLLSSNNLQSISSFGSKPSSSTLFPMTSSISGTSVAAKQEVSLPQTSLNFTPTLPSSASPSNIIKTETHTSLSHAPAVMFPSKMESVPQTQSPVENMPSKTENDVKIQSSASQPGLAISTPDLNLGPPASYDLTELSTHAKSGSVDFGGSSKSSSSVINSEPSAAEAISSVPLSSEGMVGSAKNAVSDSSHEEEMEEEAPETEQTTVFSLGSLSGFGIGSTANATTPKSNPFGVNNNTTFASSPYTMSPSSGELFRPASFNFQPPKAPEPLQPSASFSGGFSSGVPGQASAGAGFGQPANIGAGQQALGSVLGTFGQSRQLGAGLPGTNVAPASGFGSNFTGASPGGFGGGFASAPSGGGFGNLAGGGGGGGGFAAAARAVGGFAAAATGGGFAAAATAGGGFAAAAGGGGFASSASSSAVSGGGFGAFSSQQGSGGFSAFGGGSGTARPPSELFTQMRK